jgi:hypothetical protein
VGDKGEHVEEVILTRAGARRFSYYRDSPTRWRRPTKRVSDRSRSKAGSTPISGIASWLQYRFSPDNPELCPFSPIRAQILARRYCFRMFEKPVNMRAGPWDSSLGFSKVPICLRQTVTWAEHVIPILPTKVVFPLACRLQSTSTVCGIAHAPAS